MKRRLLLQIICASLLSLSSSHAKQASAAPTSDISAQKGHAQETRMLSQLLELNDSQLSQLRQTIERIEKMPPEERIAMRQRIKKMHAMDPDKVRAMRQRYQEIPKETRDTMRQRWLDMGPDERKEWRLKLREMSPEERMATLKKQGFLPPPNKRKGAQPDLHKARKPHGKGQRQHGPTSSVRPQESPYE